jgi:cysteine desulfurase
MDMPVYFDCCATTPIDPTVRSVFLKYIDDDFGNAGSRTHIYGLTAKTAIQNARQQIAESLAANPEEVIFTSGATEANNLAILGLIRALSSHKCHIIATAIEHKAVLEPVSSLLGPDVEVTFIEPSVDGRINPLKVKEALRPDTVLVTCMHVNNETGIIQPINEIAEVLVDHPAYFHTDSAQGAGFLLSELRNHRIDMISLSGHKIYAPKGIGCLIARRRGYRMPPIVSLQYGGGQERNIRPGTLPVALIAAFGEAINQCRSQGDARRKQCNNLRDQVLACFGNLNAQLIGDQYYCLPNVVSLRIPEIDSEALMLTIKDLIAISNGSACTSTSYSPSHVLTAMGLTERVANECVRISWCHMSKEANWDEIYTRVNKLL